ncbi:hypothetical protein [Streptomyces swartbergensis]
MTLVNPGHFGTGLSVSRETGARLLATVRDADPIRVEPADD